MEIVPIVTLQTGIAKSWKLEEIAQQAYHACKVDAWIYYCALCDEILMITRRFVEAKGVQAAFDEVCPDCGFSLEDVMRCEQTKVPEARAAYVDPKFPKAALLFELPLKTLDAVKVRTAGLPAEEQILTTGIDKLDKLVRLTTGQFVVFRGHPFARSLAELLCVRAQLDHPIGLNSASVFIDGENRFDAYEVSNYAIEHRIEPELALSRIHISRAFTYFQLASLLTEKLPSALTHYNSKLAIVSNITELFQDPEIKDKREAHRIFQRISRSLATIAEITDSLVIATNFQDIKAFETILTQTAHTTIFTESHNAFTRFALTRHRSLGTQKISHCDGRFDQFLEE